MALIMPTSTRRTVVADTSMQTGGKVTVKVPNQLLKVVLSLSGKRVFFCSDKEEEEKP